MHKWKFDPVGVILQPLFVIWFLLEELFITVFGPLVRAFRRLRVVQGIERVMVASPRWIALLWFILPIGAMFPLKLYTLFLIGTGHFILGGIGFLLIKIVGTTVGLWVYRVLRPNQLATFPWFVCVEAWVFRVREAIHTWIKSLDLYWWTKLKILELKFYMTEFKWWMKARFSKH